MSTNKERAFKLLNEISYVRVAGTKEEERCANQLLDYCKAHGVECEIETFEIDMANIEKATLEVNGAESFEVKCEGIGNSGVTEDEGICAPLCYVENVLEANIQDIKGKIVLISGPVKPEQMKKMHDDGAVGYIQIFGSIYDPEEMWPEIRTRNTKYKPGEEINFPGVVIHISDAEKILRANPETVKICLKQELNSKGVSRNVIATIPGVEKPEEIITFSAHFDSVIYSNGAWDNATGSVTIMELMHYFQEHKPSRTLKFIWCGAEEIGLRGSKAYVEKHKDELKNYLFNINVDMTGVLIGFDIAVCSCEEATAKYIDYLGKIEGFPIASKVDMYSSDSTSFAMVGVPAVTFARLAPQGGATIHSRRDIMDRLDPQVFINTVNFMASFSEKLINAKVFPVSKQMPKELSEKMDRMKKMFAEMEGKKEEPKKEESNKEQQK